MVPGALHMHIELHETIADAYNHPNGVLSADSDDLAHSHRAHPGILRHPPIVLYQRIA
jgi:hypothetical protein